MVWCHLPVSLNSIASSGLRIYSIYGTSDSCLVKDLQEVMAKLLYPITVCVVVAVVRGWALKFLSCQC